MIVFAALTPHSPLLLPSVNKEKLSKVELTRRAMATLADELYAARPDTIVIISSHGTMYDDAFSINLHDEYAIDLSQFGDLTTHRGFEPDLQTIDRLQRSLRRRHFPLTLSSDATLDYGAAVPLLMLTEHLPDVRIVPISYSGLPAKDHFNFGAALQEVLMNESKRIAVISTGDQSHALSADSPAGFAKEGVEYDQAVQSSIVNLNPAALLKLDKKKIAKAKECSYQSLLILQGILEHLQYQPIVHSYEAPFGVGYLVVNFELA